MGEWLLEFGSKVVAEDVVHQFGDLAQAPRAQLGNNSTHPCNFLKLFLRRLEDLARPGADLLLESCKGGGALVVVGKVRHVLKQDQLQWIRDLWRYRAAVELLQPLDGRGKSIGFIHRRGRGRAFTKRPGSG